MRTHFLVIILATVVACITVTACGQEIPSLSGSGVFAAEPLWIYEADEIIISTPIVARDTMYIRTSQHIRAVELDSQDTVWEQRTAGEKLQTHPPVVEGNIILVPEKEGAVAAFSTITGELLWRHCNLCRGYDDPTDVLIRGQIAYVTRRDDELTAYDVEMGTVLWKADGPHRWAPQLAYSNDAILLAVYYIKAFEPESGVLLWEEDFDGSFGRIMATNETVYAVMENASDITVIIAFDMEEGLSEWAFELEADALLMEFYITPTSDYLIVSGGRHLWAIDPSTGSREWYYESDMILYEPVVAGEIVFVRAQNSALALDINGGKLLGSVNLLDIPVRSTSEINPVVTEDILLMPLGGKWIAAYSLDNLQEVK